MENPVKNWIFQGGNFNPPTTPSILASSPSPIRTWHNLLLFFSNTTPPLKKNKTNVFSKSIRPQYIKKASTHTTINEKNKNRKRDTENKGKIKKNMKPFRPFVSKVTKTMIEIYWINAHNYRFAELSWSWLAIKQDQARLKKFFLHLCSPVFICSFYLSDKGRFLRKQKQTCHVAYLTVS